MDAALSPVVPPLHPSSVVVAAGRPDGPGSPISTPIVLTAPYRHDPEDNRYSREGGTETQRAFETALGALEGGIALAFGSGMAALAAVVETRPVGTVVVVPESGYSGTVSIFAEQERLGRLVVRRVDTTDTGAVLASLPGAGLVWLETVTNPLMGVPELDVIIPAARELGVLVGVDATFSTPLLVRPLSLGADVVMHSATKAISGHSDLLMGALVTEPGALHTELADRRTLAGAVPGALESYLALRGLRTLALRLERAQASAGLLAQRLATHPAVARVRYAGLPSDPGHARAAQLYDGFGTMLAFEVAAGSDAAGSGAAGSDAAGSDAAERVCAAVRLITHATSLGGVESLIERRARYAVDAGAGTPANLVRLSVGIEHVEDLWADLAQALDAATR